MFHVKLLRVFLSTTTTQGTQSSTWNKPVPESGPTQVPEQWSGPSGTARSLFRLDLAADRAVMIRRKDDKPITRPIVSRGTPNSNNDSPDIHSQNPCVQSCGQALNKRVQLLSLKQRIQAIKKAPRRVPFIRKPPTDYSGRISAAWGPLGPSLTSYCTAWPSFRLR